jgi:hypothetical protein
MEMIDKSQKERRFKIMKKFILMLVFVLGTFTFSEITTSEVESFFTPKAQIYVSNQKDWFSGMDPASDNDEIIWEKLNYFINVVPVGNKYRVSYTPFDNVKSYNKEKYPILNYKIEKKYYVNSKKNQNTPVTDSYEIRVEFGVINTGTEIKKGNKYERTDFQMLSENELNALLKSKNAKRLNSETEKNTKIYLDWLQHNAN